MVSCQAEWAHPKLGSEVHLAVGVKNLQNGGKGSKFKDHFEIKTLKNSFDALEKWANEKIQDRKTHRVAR